MTLVPQSPVLLCAAQASQPEYFVIFSPMHCRTASPSTSHGGDKAPPLTSRGERRKSAIASLEEWASPRFTPQADERPSSPFACSPTRLKNSTVRPQRRGYASAGEISGGQPPLLPLQPGLVVEAAAAALSAHLQIQAVAKEERRQHRLRLSVSEIAGHGATDAFNDLI